MEKNNKSINMAYMPIYDPVSFRRHLLLSGIDVIRMLEKYESLKQVRAEKKKIILELKEKLISLNEDAEVLKEKFPLIKETELKQESKKIEKKVERLDESKPKRSEGYKHLEKELYELQEKLSRLNI